MHWMRKVYKNFAAYYIRGDVVKFTNETQYSTQDLKKVFDAVSRHEGIKPPSLRVFTAKVPKWCAPTCFSTVVRGAAWRLSKHIDIGIPKHLLDVKAGVQGASSIVTVPLKELDSDQVRTVARVYSHELAHIRGVAKHKDMIPWTSYDVDYLGDARVRLKQPKKSRDIKQERYIKALDKVKAYRTKLKRDTTLLNKWLRKVKHYEKNIGL